MVEEGKGVVSTNGRFKRGMFGSICWASAVNCKRHESLRWTRHFPVIFWWTRAGVDVDLQLVKWAPITCQEYKPYMFRVSLLACSHLPSLRLSLRTSYSEDQECL